MAMIKCSTCGRMVSDKEKTCPNCGGQTDTRIYCPRCNSTNIKVQVKSADDVTASLIAIYFGIFAAKAAQKNRIKYVCNDCKKKFKLK
ncbi:MAG: hypothetical protein IKT46_09870 [Clostridia bacterium]|nr:hypothetical protein [Clostridia bacterium]